MCSVKASKVAMVVVLAVAGARSARASTGCAQSGTFAIDNRDGSGLRLTSLQPQYQGVFAEGVDVINTITATVDWAGRTPSIVVFQLNGVNSDVATSGTTAQTTYNMGDDLQYSRGGAQNVLRVWAVSADGALSQPWTIDLWGLALPTWAISSESKKGPINWRFEPLTGKVAFYGEVQVVVNPADPEGKVKATVNIPNSIPEIGGKWGVEIEPLDFTWELAARPRYGDGARLTGSFELGGKWAADAACGSKRKGALSAAITGAGEFYPQFRLTDVSAELAGSFTFLFPRVPLLCQWTGCCHTGYCPYFQASIKPEVIGTVGMEEGEPSLIAGLRFKNAELNIGVTVAGTVGAGSEGSIYYIAGSIGGKPYIIVQLPGDPSSSCLNQYIKEVGFDIVARYVVECAWWKVEDEWVFNLFRCPDTGMVYAVGTQSGARRVVPVGREYLRAIEGYCVFPTGGDGRGIASVGGLPEPILNVGTGPMPSMAASSDNGLLLFVYDDAGKPTGKHQEIYWARWTGSAWTAHAALTNNQQPDLYPAAAIDSAGKEIAVWVRAPEPTGAETGPRDILPGTEIVFATFDAGTGTWATPQALTSNAYADLLPWFERLPGDGLRVLWISSATNAIPVWHDEEIAPSLDVMAADWSGSAFGSAYAVATGLVAVSPPSVTRTDTREFLAYLKDTDGNSGTAEDREVVVRSRAIGGAWEADQQLTGDAFSDTAAQLAVDQNGVPMVTWVKRLVPVTLPDLTESHVDQLWFARWTGTGWDAPTLAFEAEGIAEPKLVRNEAGRIVLFWVAASAEFSDIYYSVFDADRVQWGLPQQVTHDQGAETMLSLAESGGNVLAAYVKRRIDLTDPSGVPQIGLSDLYLLEHVPTRDLSVSAADLSFEPTPAERGQEVAVCANVTLSGDFVADDVLVRFYDGDPGTSGTLIGSDTIATLLPGQSQSACVTWMVPDDGQAHEVYVFVDPDNTVPETDDLANNIAHVAAFGPDLRIDGPYFLGCPSADTVLVGMTIRNDGSALAGPSVCQLRRDDVGGELLSGEDIPALEPGESSSVQFAWDVSSVAAGSYVIVGVADSSGVVNESNEGNNIASANVPVLPDLQPEVWSVQVETGQVRVLVKNIGTKPSAATTLRAVAAGQTLGEADVSALAPGGDVEVVVSTAGGTPGALATLTANPDSDGTDEASLLNNQVVARLAVLPDFDSDGDVDLADFGFFQTCFNGPNRPFAFGSCAVADFDEDDDVDLSDFAAFLACFNGPNRPPACGE